MDPADDPQQARAAYAGQAWLRAATLFARADANTPLEPSDLELAAEAAEMCGRGDEAVRLLRRAYLGYAETGATGPASASSPAAIRGDGGLAEAQLATATIVIAGGALRASRALRRIAEVGRVAGRGQTHRVVDTGDGAAPEAIAAVRRQLAARVDASL